MRAGAAGGVNTVLIRMAATLRPARAGWLSRAGAAQSDHRHPRKFPETDLNEQATPQITMYTSAVCAYCVAAKNFLRSKGLDWSEVRVDLDAAERERMVARAGRTSVPQIFVGDVHVGGYDDMMALHRAGGFEPLLEGKGA